MRILWFTNSSACYRSVSVSASGYCGGGWMSSLQQELVKSPDVRLGICFCRDGEPEKEEQDGVVYYPVPNHRKALKDKIKDLLNFRDETRDEVLWPHYVGRFKRVIEDFKPDVIEVFGSELYAGLGALAAKELNVPCALHLQGLLSLSIYIYLPPGVSRCSYIFSRGLRGAYGNFQLLTYWHRSCHREKAILAAVSHVIGRTAWDRQALEVLNPAAEYHYGGEILRPVFYEPAERRNPQRLTITTTISHPPYKGFDLLLKIAHLLKFQLGLDFVWNCYGNVEASFVERVTHISHAEVNVCLCGVATAEQLRDALLSSTLYCHTSYIENSPNSIAEAQILGVPVVATNVGGTSSMVEDGKTGLLFPATDPYMAACQIHRLANDEVLNHKIGDAARQEALRRHNREDIVAGLLEVYSELISKVERSANEK